jgi:hypothetical protein
MTAVDLPGVARRVIVLPVPVVSAEAVREAHDTLVVGLMVFALMLLGVLALVSPVAFAGVVLGVPVGAAGALFSGDVAEYLFGSRQR